MEFQQKSQRVSLLPSLPFPPGTAARPVPPTAPRMASLTPPERKELWLCQCLCALPTGEGARGGGWHLQPRGLHLLAEQRW